VNYIKTVVTPAADELLEYFDYVAGTDKKFSWVECIKLRRIKAMTRDMERSRIDIKWGTSYKQHIIM